jgi:predicted  nucleic acid-binding Zn-ribbon protein
MTDQVQAMIDKGEGAKLKALWNEAIARLQALLPVEAELNRWKAEKSKRLAELQAIKAEVEENNKVIVSHNLHLADVKRQIAHAKEELNVWLNDIGRASKDFEALSLEVERMKRGQQ